MKKYLELIVKGAGAALLIGLGDYVLLKAGNPVGPVLFSFGLLGVCVLGLNLFTGKCGFLIEDKIRVFDLGLILVSNLVFGYLFGAMFGLADGEVVSVAVSKVGGWELSLAFLIKAMLCGMIMYLAVKLYKKGTSLGVLIGVPLFIFSGMQHSIANVITLGVSLEFSLGLVLIILLCVLGNFLGAILAWFLSGEMFERKEKSLKKVLKEAEVLEGRELKIHGVYRHFKGKYYIVEGVATGSEDLEEYVVYRQLYGDGGLYIRPKEMFLSEVDHKKYPKIKQKFRFEEREVKE
ncbi:DUF1653 domain-containing protein [Candidatus Saccharibacteria bacterium]|nr:DUF1653 domain-containing protein [Candidatus Saccharibacteria bacterium]